MLLFCKSMRVYLTQEWKKRKKETDLPRFHSSKRLVKCIYLSGFIQRRVGQKVGADGKIGWTHSDYPNLSSSPFS